MADDKLARLDYYTLLGVKRDVPEVEIRRAFRTFALKYHPDRFAGESDEKRLRATDIYRRGSEAVECLTDTEKRKVYDAGLAKGIMRLTTDAKSASSRTSRSQHPGAKSGAAASPAIQSPSARAYFQKATDAAKRGDIEGAFRSLTSAREQEPGNSLIEDALRKVSDRMRSR